MVNGCLRPTVARLFDPRDRLQPLQSSLRERCGLSTSIAAYANARGTSAHRVVYSGVFNVCFIRQAP